MPWTYVISDLNDEEIVGTFYKKELQKTNQKEFRIEKVIMRKRDKLYVKWERHDNSFGLTVGLIKKISSYKMSYFSEPYTRSKKN